jgi:hypothetical protein
VTTLPNIGLTLPVRGAPGSGVWSDTIDADLGLLDVHNHTTGKGLPVPVAGLNINADLPFGGAFGATQLQRVQFSAVTALASNNLSLFVNTADNELYFRTSAGANVKLTSGAALNVGAFTGGIGGDYAAVAAVADYVDATDTYRFRQQLGAGVNQFARVATAGVDLFEYFASGVSPVPGTRVRLKSPASLAASYDVTWPGALPAAAGQMIIDSTGAITTSVSRTFTAPIAHPSQGSTMTFSSAVGGVLGWVFGTDTGHLICPLPLPVGFRLTSWTLYGAKTSTSGTMTAKLFDFDMTTGAAPTQIGATQSNSANNPGVITLGQAGLTTTTVAGHSYFIDVGPGSGITGDVVYGWAAAA